MTPKGHPRAIAAIVGAGRTKFGELWYQNPEKLLFEAGSKEFWRLYEECKNLEIERVGKKVRQMSGLES